MTATEEVTTPSLSGCIFHSIPSVTWWDLETENALEIYNAFTVPVDTSGISLGYYNHGLTGIIDYAYIYYNPSVIFSGRTPDANHTTVAHEIGHALGFGHESPGSIMCPTQYSFTGLTQIDIDNFEYKYPKAVPPESE